MEKNETNWNGLTNWYKQLKFAYELGFDLTAATAVQEVDC